MSEHIHVPDGPTTRCGDHMFSYCRVCRMSIKQPIAPWSLVDEGDAAQADMRHKVYDEAFRASAEKSEGTTSSYGGLAKAHAIALSAVDAMKRVEEES